MSKYRISDIFDSAPRPENTARENSYSGICSAVFFMSKDKKKKRK